MGKTCVFYLENCLDIIPKKPEYLKLNNLESETEPKFYEVLCKMICKTLCIESSKVDNKFPSSQNV